MPNSHRHARHDKTVLSVSRPLRQCQLDSRQLKAAQTLSDGLETQSTPPATTQTTLSCRVWRGGVNWALHDALIGAVRQRRDMIGCNCGTELGRPVLSQLVRCEHSRWKTRVQNYRVHSVCVL